MAKMRNRDVVDHAELALVKSVRAWCRRPTGVGWQDIEKLKDQYQRLYLGGEKPLEEVTRGSTLKVA